MKTIALVAATVALLGALSGCSSLNTQASNNACSGPPSVCNTDFGAR